MLQLEDIASDHDDVMVAGAVARVRKIHSLSAESLSRVQRLMEAMNADVEGDANADMIDSTNAIYDEIIAEFAVDDMAQELLKNLPYTQKTELMPFFFPATPSE